VASGVNLPPIADCLNPWEWAHVSATGDLRPCCFAIRPVGNVVAAGSFDGVWNGPVMQDLRGSIREGRVHPLCRGAGCSFARETERSLALRSYRLECEVGTIVRPGESSHHLLDGWAWPEPWGAWTDGPVARMALRPVGDATDDLMLCARACAFLPSPAQRLEVAIRANGRALGAWSFQTSDGRSFTETSVAFGGAIERRVAIPHGRVADETGHVVLEFEVDPPRSPIEFGLGGDDRRLGMGLLAFWLAPIQKRRRVGNWTRRWLLPWSTIRYAHT
jgi:Iron-sulfur cluster-binding domain